MQNFEQAAVLGAGVIGASWTSLFLAGGLKVDVYDPSPDVERSVRNFIEHAWPTLESLEMTAHGNPDRVQFHRSAEMAVKGAEFVQESVPEKLPLKHDLYALIEPALSSDAIVASSASGLMVSEMQISWRDPSRFMLGHPFNPPHIIPLVELLTNERTAEGVTEAAENF